MTTATIRPAPVRKSITVPTSPERAFEVFTARFGVWWPRSHHIGASALASAVIEPRAGGRWYEVGEDGAECAWGDVLAWEPPSRLLLAWRIGADWKHHPDLLTEVEVTFTAAGAGATRVDLEHRLLERMGEDAQRVRESVDSDGGWSGILKSYADAI